MGKAKPSVVRTRNAGLTAKAVEALAPGRKITDGSIPPGFGGLVVRARRIERQSMTVREFFFRYHDEHGADRLLLVGQHPEVTLAAARARVFELRELVRSGIDPHHARDAAARENRERQRIEREAAERERRQGTLADLVDAYIDKLESEGKTASARDVRRSLNLHVIERFPELAARPAGEITKQDIADILAAMIARGVTTRTNRIRSFLSSAYTYGARIEFDPRRQARLMTEDQPAKRFHIDANPVAAVSPQRDYEVARDRVLSDAELRHYCETLTQVITDGLAGKKPADKKDAEEEATVDFGVPVAALLRACLLLGGQRMAQLGRLTWQDYDADAAVIRLHDSKGRGSVREHLLPVSTTVAELLESLRPAKAEGYVFTTTGGKKPIHASTESKAAAAVSALYRRAHAGAQPYKGSDIRRTVETRLAALGVSKDVRAQLLSHGRERNIQDRVYDRHDYLPEKAAALAKWEAEIARVLTGEPTTVVHARFGSGRAGRA